jgi:hypothetical protein
VGNFGERFSGMSGWQIEFWKSGMKCTVRDALLEMHLKKGAEIFYPIKTSKKEQRPDSQRKKGGKDEGIKSG